MSQGQDGGVTLHMVDPPVASRPRSNDRKGGFQEDFVFCLSSFSAILQLFSFHVNYPSVARFFLIFFCFHFPSSRGKGVKLQTGRH